MRIAAFADLHIQAGPRFEDQRACLAANVDRMLDERPDLFIVAGDVFGSAVPYRPRPIERALWEPQLSRLAKAAPVVVVRGNHDDAETIRRMADIAGTFPIYPVVGAEVLDVSTPTGGRALVYCMAHPSKSWLVSSADVRGMREVQAAVERRLQTLFSLWGMRIARARQADPEVVHVVAAHVMIGASVTSGGEVLSAVEIELSSADVEQLDADAVVLGHVHKLQSIATRAFYCGSLWRTSFAETEPKGWLRLDVMNDADSLGLRSEWIESPCRDFVTLDWRWAADHDGGDPRWVERPLGGYSNVRGAEVRARLVVPDTFASSVPWDRELERVRAAGAHRIVTERTIEPTVRARAPQLADATTNAERLGLYWGTLESPPIDVERAAALDVLAELEQDHDDVIRQRSETIAKGGSDV